MPPGWGNALSKNDFEKGSNTKWESNQIARKSHLLSPTSHHLQVSLLLTDPKCGAAAGRRGSSARRRQVLQVGREKAGLQGGSCVLGCDSQQVALAAEIEKHMAVRV